MLSPERHAKHRRRRCYGESKTTMLVKTSISAASIFLFLVFCSLRQSRLESTVSTSPSVFYSSLLKDGVTNWLVEDSPHETLQKGKLGIAGDSETTQDLTISSNNALNIRIIETWGCHDEVTAAFLYSFRETSHKVQCFFRNQRFGIGQLYDAFFRQSITQPQYHTVDDFKEMQKKEDEPEVIISISCRWDMQHNYDRLGMDRILEESDAVLYCLVHLCDEWNDVEREVKERMKKWADANRIRWLTLSPHVSKCVSWQVLPVIGIMDQTSPSAIIRTFPPIFEPTLDASGKVDIDAKDASFFLSREKRHTEIVVQGNVEAFRRNYQQIFDDLKEQIRRHSSSVLKSKLFAKLSITILGQISPYHEDSRTSLDTVSIQSKIAYKHGLSYVDFYQALSDASLLLPAFADNAYRLTRASSSVAASIISGLPLVVDLDLLTRYSYLPLEAVWVLGEEETEMEGALRILSASAYDRAEKRLQLAILRDRLMKENANNMQLWLQQDSRHDRMNQ